MGRLALVESMGLMALEQVGAVAAVWQEVLAPKESNRWLLSKVDCCFRLFRDFSLLFRSWLLWTLIKNIKRLSEREKVLLTDQKILLRVVCNVCKNYSRSIRESSTIPYHFYFLRYSFHAKDATHLVLTPQRPFSRIIASLLRTILVVL